MTTQETGMQFAERTVRRWKERARNGEEFTIKLNDESQLHINKQGWSTWIDTEGNEHPCGQALTAINRLAEGKHPYVSPTASMPQAAPAGAAASAEGETSEEKPKRASGQPKQQRTRVVQGNKEEIAAQVLKMKEDENKTPREIADAMGWANVSSVHDYLRLGRKLREQS